MKADNKRERKIVSTKYFLEYITLKKNLGAANWLKFFFVNLTHQNLIGTSGNGITLVYWHKVYNCSTVISISYKLDQVYNIISHVQNVWKTSWWKSGIHKLDRLISI